MPENVNPTRMELINAKKRIRLAEKGHGLLKKKRDALIMEFFKVLKKAKDQRKIVNSILKEAYRNLLVAELNYDKAQLESVIISSQRYANIYTSTRNIMGLKIPDIKTDKTESKYYELVLPSPALSNARKLFQEAIKLIIELAETEIAIKRIIREIEKTKRRVNALEYIIIPKLKNNAKLIAFRLEEMERDTFIMLKTLKNKRVKD
ncbi:MAG: V-type ATP synthase subunit D [Candidatus Micrarchaeota archaeon]|nr:V-type ATP synthase subunit D [Candidatus Micrarchaeota archaeon]